MEGSVTLRFWHGGVLKRTNRGLQYVGGQAKNYAVDPDELCWFFLKQLAENVVLTMMFMRYYTSLPHCSMDDGLKRVYNDKEVLKMGAIVVENRSIDLFTIHGSNNTLETSVSPTKMTPPQKSSPVRRSPRFKQTNEPPPVATQSTLSYLNITFQAHEPQQNSQNTFTPENLSAEDPQNQPKNQPENPENNNSKQIPDEEYYKCEDSDPLYEPDRGEEIVTEESLGSDAGLQDDFEDAGLEEEFEVEIDVEDDVNVLVEEGDSSDDELKEARERQKKTTAQLIELAQQVQKDAVATAAGQGTNVPSTSEVNKDGYVSEYADSDDEELTPMKDGDEEGTISKKRAKKLVVHEGTDWNHLSGRSVNAFQIGSHLRKLLQSMLCTKSILSAVAKLLPEAEHRHCARHIYAHWAKSFRGDEFKQLFWRAAKAYNEADYNDALQEMEQVNSASVDAFKRYNPRLFCRAFMNTDTKVDVIVNNLAETFNGYIVSARTKHLLYMLEDIRTALMQRLAVKKKEMQRSVSIICPRIEEKLEKAKKDAAECNVVPSSATVFQVSHKMDILSVDLEARSCTCRRWDLTGIPCCHAVSSIFFCHRNAEDYVAHWYTKDTYARSYTVSIPPCVGDRHWPKVSRGVIEPAQTTGVLNATAQPTRLGRGGRVIRGGRGSRGGSTSGGGRGGINSRTGRGRGTGRGSTSGVEVATVTGRGRTRGRGRGRMGRGGQFPEGIGLIVANDGASYFNSIGMESPVQLTPSSTTSARCEVGTQSSAAAT
ncbi:Antiviral helicase SKI2 [Bienertia sinuspersici]